MLSASTAVNQLICDLYGKLISFPVSCISADIIDNFLLAADKNNDGYLNFHEYKETLRDDATDHELGAGDHPSDDDEQNNNL